MNRMLAMAMLLFALPLAAGELYKWTDADGTVHFSDRAPEAGAERVELEPLNVADPVAAELPGGDDGDGAPTAGSHARVTMYSTSWCGYCKQARQYFLARGIPFREYDIEASARARAAYERLGAGGVPLLKVGDHTMNGFSERGFERFYGR